MKKVLYISNIEVPYRTIFFNKLAKKCDLTIVYERKKSNNRNAEWSKSENILYKVEYLNGIKIKNEFSFDFKINKYIFGNYDCIILGCYNSLIQMYANIMLRIFNKKFYINLDGEYYLNGDSIKSKIKRFFINGAEKYLVAGDKASQNLKQIIDSKKIYTYHFSSLTKKKIEENSFNYIENNKEKYILVVGQYFNYKGLDLALEIAKILPDMKFKFIGMDKKSEEFKQLVSKENIKNIEIVPFLKKDKLYEEYKNCKLLLLTSRKECWGLVINEAASFGTPIIASKYAGAGVEFLEDNYSQFLIDPYNAENSANKIKELLNYEEIEKYKQFLIYKSQKYSIEENVDRYIEAIEC